MRLNPKKEAIEKIEKIHKELLLEEQKGGQKASRKLLNNIFIQKE
ncbi:hypothetical protein [Campylobacter armoricus]|nr:hypothetical protein [Campylobacter armoricus]